MHNIFEFYLLFFGGSAIFLLSLKSKKISRYGFWCGLISQPGWLYISLTSKHLAMLILSLWYSFAWCNGVRNNFFKRGTK